ncbi:MAG: DAK2 domain-containing protein, partial [Coriobacteriia bacterium]|nr:DAK2 domain-containing protein [Coriobacteriia bacterium]
MSPEPAFLTLVSAAAGALRERQDDVDKLNVFPVPDGDTGTNMSLTMDAVLSELRSLPYDSDVSAVCSAITHGSLMGARGNSGVILSQVVRGVCDILGNAPALEPATIAEALERAQVVAFQAVRKPVEGTMLTVL